VLFIQTTITRILYNDHYWRHGAVLSCYSEEVTVCFYDMSVQFHRIPILRCPLIWQCILFHQPPVCNYANINSGPFDLNPVAVEGSPAFLQRNACTVNQVFPFGPFFILQLNRVALPGLVVLSSLLQRSPDGWLCLGPCRTSDDRPRLSP
jgi:hypothetical protein